MGQSDGTGSAQTATMIGVVSTSRSDRRAILQYLQLTPLQIWAQTRAQRDTINALARHVAYTCTDDSCLFVQWCKAMVARDIPTRATLKQQLLEYYGLDE